jgi:hypothetical protein
MSRNKQVAHSVFAPMVTDIVAKRKPNCSPPAIAERSSGEVVVLASMDLAEEEEVRESGHSKRDSPSDNLAG